MKKRRNPCVFVINNRTFAFKIRTISQASVAALYFVACQSKKRANTSKLCKYNQSPLLFI